MRGGKGFVSKMLDYFDGTSGHEIKKFGTHQGLYMLLVNGSVLSLFPKICVVFAVVIGLINSLLRIPFSAIFSFNPAQSQWSEGFTSHMSYWSSPLEAGEPSQVS